MLLTRVRALALPLVLARADVPVHAPVQVLIVGLVLQLVLALA